MNFKEYILESGSKVLDKIFTERVKQAILDRWLTCMDLLSEYEILLYVTPSEPFIHHTNYKHVVDTLSIDFDNTLFYWYRFKPDSSGFCPVQGAHGISKNMLVKVRDNVLHTYGGIELELNQIPDL